MLVVYRSGTLHAKSWWRGRETQLLLFDVVCLCVGVLGRIRYDASA
jgi:hypothetical protein